MIKKGIIALVFLVLAIPMVGSPISALNTVENFASITPQYSPGEEIIELRDQYSRTTMGENGNLVLTSYMGSIHYEDGNGNFQSITTTMTPSQKPNWDWEVETGHWQLYINNDTTVKVQKGNNWVRHRFHGIAYLDIVTKEYKIIQIVTEQEPTVFGNTIKWENLLYELDYVIRYTNDSFKEAVIIKQPLRDILNQSGYRPADFGLNPASTYLVPIYEVDWSQSLPMRLRSGQVVNPDEAEHEQAIYFESPVKDKYFDTNLVSFFPLDYAISANPTNPDDPEEEWVYASEPIRKRLIKKNDKHWLLTGVLVFKLNQMPEGAIVFDPTETLRPDGAGDETNLTIGGSSPAATNWESVDEVSADDATTVVITSNDGYLRDLYSVADHSVGSGTINKITVYARCMGTTAVDQPSLKITIKSGATIDDAEKTVTLSWADYSQEWALNPDDSEAWEWADIDAQQIGVALQRCVSGLAKATNCTQVYVEVDYTPPAPDPPTNVSATDGAYSDKVVITWTKSDWATGYQIYRDGAPLGWLGDVATGDDTGAGAPTITPGATVASDGTYSYVVLSLAGTSTTDGTTYTYKVQARNDTGESDNSTTNTGYRAIPSLNYQWQRSSADADADYSNIAGGTTDPYNDTDAPTDGSGRYYKAVLSASGVTTQYSSNDRGYRTIAVSEARYYGTIIVSNNSTATNYVSVNCTISTENLINGDYLNSAADNCKITSSAGADLPFMPSVNASYPWCIWVPAIGSNASMADIFYTANSTGGEIRYFPGVGGMETPDDNVSFEPSANFTIEQSGWVDTSFPGTSTLTDDFDTDVWTDVGAGVGVNTANSRMEWDTTNNAESSYRDIAGVSDAVWEMQYTYRATTVGAAAISGIGLLDSPNGDWGTAGAHDAIYMRITDLNVTAKAWDGGALTTTAAIVIVANTTYYITLERVASDNISLSIFTDAARTTHRAGSPVWVTIPATIIGLDTLEVAGYVGGNQSVGWLDDLELTPLPKFLVNKRGAFITYISSADNITSTMVGTAASVNATGVSSGFYTITTSANSTHMTISIDGVVQDTVILGGATIPNTTANWTFCQNDSIIYLEYQEITIGGVLQQRIEWEYDDSIFTDLSGQGHDAIPTFRTTSSDPDVSAVLTSFLPVSEAKAPAYALEDAPAFIETVPTIVSEWAVTPPAKTFPLAGVVRAVASATDTPAQLPLLIIAAFVIIACSLAVSATMRRYGSGSLIVKSAVITALMGIFIAIGNFGIDFWMLFVFLVIAVALSMGSKQVGWQ